MESAKSITLPSAWRGLLRWLCICARYRAGLAAAVLSGIALSVVACSSGPLPTTSTSPVSAPSRSPSAAGEWVLQEGTYLDRPIPQVPGHPITLVVAANQLSGVAACNNYWADIERSDVGLQLSNVRAGGQACVRSDVMASEQAYLTILPWITHIDYSEPGSLTLEGPDLVLRFSPKPDAMPD